MIGEALRYATSASLAEEAGALATALGKLPAAS
jgi:hypothetical protein